MKMYVDFQQYLLTASLLVAPVVLSCGVLFVAVKVLAKVSGDSFRFSWPAHLVCVAVACAFSPFVALFFVNRPAELMGGSGKGLLVGALTALIVVVAAEEYFRTKRGQKSRDQA